MFEQIVFYAFAGLLIFSASMVITVRNPVFAALFLVFSFFSCAAIWLILEAEFLAIALVLVYVGAVMVLFLFVIMMLDVNLAPLREGFARRLPIGISVAVLMMIAIGWVLVPHNFDSEKLSAVTKHGPEYSNTAELGQALFTNYLYPFEIAGAILLVAIIAAISLTMRPPRSSKAQRPGEQVLVKREDRVRLVKMKSEQPDTGTE